MSGLRVVLTGVLCGGLFAQVSEVFVSRYNGPANGDDEARDLKIDRHGNIYITGTSAGVGTGEDFLTLKYNSAGELLWARRYDGPGHGSDSARALALDDQGNVYVTGESLGDGTDMDFATIKYDPHGNELWVARYDGPDHLQDHAVAIAVDGHGRVYVIGSSMNDKGYWDYATVAYDTAGNQLWVQQIDGPDYLFYLAATLVLDSKGDVYAVVSFDGDETGMDYATVKYDAQGNQLWSKRYDGPESDYDIPFSAAVDGEGSVYVTGESFGPAGNYEIATIKYDANGNQLWAQRYNDGGRRTQDNAGRAITVDAQGFVYVAGTSVDGIFSDYVTIKYGPDGSELWSRFYRGSSEGANVPTAVAVDSHGSVYVTGSSVGEGTSSDYATLKYDADGNQVWVERYDGPAHRQDVANALALDGHGNVYVTGSSMSLDVGLDSATIKYLQK